MANVLKQATVTTRAARAKLAEGVHWRSIDPDIHLGYRKAIRGGRWLVRWYLGEQAYQQQTLATADDALPADGHSALSFDQATSAARTHVAGCRAEALAKKKGPPISVRNAVESYLALREGREALQCGAAGLKRDARSRLTRHVLTHTIAENLLHTLDEMDFRNWRAGLAPHLAPGTVRRLTNDFKAALNHAAWIHRSQIPAELQGSIKNGLKANHVQSGDARRQVLVDADVRSLISAAWEIDVEGNWEGDLARMVIVLAATGARFSQVNRIQVSDVQPTALRVMVPSSRKGRGEKKIDRVAVRVGEDVIAALRPALSNRLGSDPLLERWRHVQTGVRDWVRDRRGAWLSASDMARPWAQILTRSKLPIKTIPYALRHSSIVRGLRSGLPVRLVAALHDTSTAMIERHYSAYIVDAMDELSARAVVPLTK